MNGSDGAANPLRRPLKDRLRRLRRDPDPAPDLERLERELLGEASPDGDEVASLKTRLEALVAATAERDRRGRAGGRPEPPPVPLEELVAGMRRENERGEFFVVDTSVHLEVRHGDVPLSRLHTVAPGTVSVLAAEAELGDFDLGDAVFLDTETTGLAGGTGTAAFLIGAGWVEGDRFVVRQYFMRDYHEEAALLQGLADDLAGFSRIVTYNGKAFDVPLLEARFHLNRSLFPLAEAPHLDLLHPARRLWKARLESCRLQSLELALLGLRRHGDIPGDEIPQVYFDWVRRRDARMLARVFEHNRQDIVSLAALAVLACQWVEESQAEDPRDVYSLARVLERAHLFERSEEEYRRAVTLGAGDLEGPALLRLGLRAKRAGDFARAADLWEEAGKAGEPEGWRELAMHHEHRTRDLEAALRAVDRGIRVVEHDRDARSWHLREGLRHRRERLRRKQARRRE
ncbi:MAG: ribonuclease H-like domain-containing protein [Acidobacteria bacterium]|jgi:hypothetical protein|nr:ribonuclease H-like domain-containing protein [Acidobacteriota bacterium]